MSEEVPGISSAELPGGYVIKSSKHDWRLCKIIQVQNKETGKVEEKAVAEKYSGSLPGIIKIYYELLNRTTPYASVQDLIDNFRSNREKIEQALSEAGLQSPF